MMFKRVCAVLFFITSLTVTAQIEVPDTVREQIITAVISERGYYDAAEIEARIRLWQMQQPQPKASGVMTESGNCGSSCEQTGGNTALPMPRDVKFKGRMENGEYTQNLIIKWKRPQALPEGSPYELKHYKVMLSKDGMTYEKFKVNAEFNNNGKPKNKQKLKLRDLEPGNYTVQVRAKYKTVSTNEAADKAASNKSTGTSSPWSSSTSGSSKKGATTVADVQSTNPILYQCLLDDGLEKVFNQLQAVTNSTLLTDVVYLECVNKGLTNADAINIGNYLTGLAHLNISQNALITDISGIVGSLTHLEWFDISYNDALDLTTASNSLSQLDSLETIYLIQMELTQIPPLPDTVTYINVSYNKISNHYGNLPNTKIIDTLVINNNRTAWAPDGPLSLTDAFFDSLSDRDFKTIQARGTLMTDIDLLSDIASLDNLDIRSNYLNVNQRLQNFSGFCSLAIRSNSLVKVKDVRPIQQLFLPNNPLLRLSQSSHSPLYQPVVSDFDGSEVLACNHRDKIQNNTAPILSDMGLVQPFVLPSGKTARTLNCPLMLPVRSLTLDSACKPNEVNNFQVFEDTASARRYVTWEKHPDHDYAGWGVTHFLVKAIQNGVVIDQYTRPIGDSLDVAFHVADDGLAADTYQVQACINNNCGYERTQSAPFALGLAQPNSFETFWETAGDINKLGFKFNYPANLYTGVTKPDYFKISSTFPQANGGFTVHTLDVRNENTHPGANGWTIAAVDRRQMVGTTFMVQACSDLMGCSKPVSKAAGEPIVDNSIPVPVWKSLAADGVKGVVTIEDINDPKIILNWKFEGVTDLADKVDYIEITERKPLTKEGELISKLPDFDEPADQAKFVQAPPVTFYSHDITASLELNRLGRGYYNYSIKACQKVDDGADRCSSSVDYNSQGVALTRQGVIDDAHLLNPAPHNVGAEVWNSTTNPTYHIYWNNDYDSNSMKPDYFVVGATENQLFRWCNSEYVTEGVLGDNPTTTSVDYYKIKVAYADQGYINPNNNLYSGGWSSLEYCKNINVTEFGNDPDSSDDDGNHNIYLLACKSGVGCTETEEFYEFYVRPTDSQDRIGVPQNQTNHAGGPGSMNPGQWWHPELSGTGWHFYWANGLRQTEMSGSYAETYDLVGYWLAFKADEDKKVWTPTWFEVRLKHVYDDNLAEFFQGDLYYHEKNEAGVIETVDTGNMMLRVEHNTVLTATMLLNLDYSKGLFSQADPSENVRPFNLCDGTPETGCSNFDQQANGMVLEIEHFSILEFNPNNFPSHNDADHYSGLWQHGITNPSEPLSTAEVSMLPWIYGGLEYLAFLYYDADGVPVWVQAQTQPHSSNTSEHFPVAGYFDRYAEEQGKTLYTIPHGFNPLASKPSGFLLGDELMVVGRAGRSFEDAPGDTRFREAKFWMNVDQNIPYLGGDRPIIKQYGQATLVPGVQPANMQPLTKMANLHGIFYDIAAIEDISVSTCDPNEVTWCEILLSWYTDADFTAIQPWVKPPGASSFISLVDYIGNPANEVTCQGGVPYNEYVVTGFSCVYKTPGTYTFQLRKPKHGSLTEWIAIAESGDLTILGCDGNCDKAPIELPVSEADPVIDTSGFPGLLSHQAGAGPTAGEGGVSGGAATYQLPLAIPPGRNGVAPNLSVNYSSKGGDGVLGVGWTTSVGSNIYRCPKTVAQDGEFHAVDFSDNDRLCLDGQRLKLVSGTHFTANAEYRTEMESFTKVVYDGSGFTAWTKSGRVRTYEQHGAQQSTWQLTSEQDSFQNSLIYKYNEYDDQAVSFGTNEWLLTEIWYTGSGSTKGDRKIKFNYVDKQSGIDVSHQFGQRNEQTQQLESIETYVDNSTLVRQFAFSYRTSLSNGDLLLSGVTETAGGVSRKLLALDWSDENWSNNTWLDNSESQFSYDQLTDLNAGATGFEDLLARAQITHDYNGDGIKEYLASSPNGAERSLFFFDHNKVLRAKMDLPTITDYDGPSKQLSSADLNLDGYTDLYDSTGLYSWKKNKVLPNAFTHVSSGNITQYFDHQATLSGVELNTTALLVGNDVDFDEKASQYTFYDYNHDGLPDLLVLARPEFPQSYPLETGRRICGVGEQPSNQPSPQGCSISYQKLILFMNNTDISQNCGATNGGQTANCDPSFAAGVVLEDQLEPIIDREGEDDVWLYVWDEIEDIDDYNGDGYPDFHVVRWESGALFEEFDYQLNNLGEKLYFSDKNMNVIDHELLDLGLRQFSCEDSSGGSASCDVPADGTLNASKSFHFADINGDGLKDFVYHERAENIEKIWNVRLNQGGDMTVANPVLFAGDYHSRSNVADNLLANGVSINQPGQCDRAADGSYADRSLYRKCNPYFRAVSGMRDLDADGVPELLFPDADVTENADNLPQNMVFNYCSAFRILGSTTARPLVNSTQNASAHMSCSVPYVGADYELCTEDNIVPRYGDDAAYATNPDGSLVNPALGHIQTDPMLYKSAFNPYVINDDLDYSFTEPAVQTFIDELFIELNNQSTTQSTGPGTTIVQSCAYIPEADTSGVKDMYEDFGSRAALSDRSLYRFNAVKFNLAAGGELELELATDTGIFRPLREGAVGDLSGDGVTDNVVTAGCVFSSQICQDNAASMTNLAATGAAGWNVTTAELQSNGVAIQGKNAAVMPNMLTQATQPNSDQWVTWEHHPISADLSNQPGRTLQLYTLPERGNNGFDGYIDQVDGVGEYFFFNSSMYVVSAMNQSAGVLSYPGYNDVVSRTEYGYQEAVYHNRGRGFQGFRKITVLHQPDTGSDYNRTLSESLFHQVYPLAGKLESTTSYQYQNNNQYLLQHSSHDWSDSNLSNHSAHGVQYWPMVLQSSKSYAKDQTSLNGLTRSEQLTTYAATDCAGVSDAYDAYGNVLCSKTSTTEHVKVGNPGVQSTTTTVVTENSYKQTPDTANWWVDQLLSTKVSQTLTEGGQLGSQPGDVNRDTTSVFHWQPLGLRKLQCQFTLGGGLPAAAYNSCAVAPNDDMVSKTTFTYDAYGNITDLKSAAEIIDISSAPVNKVVQERQVETEFSQLQKHYFPTTITQKSTADLPTKNQYNSKTGQVTTSTDPNGVVTTSTYDAFGVMTAQAISHEQVSGNLDQTTHTSTQNCIVRDQNTNIPTDLCIGAHSILGSLLSYVQNTVSAQLAGEYNLSHNTGLFLSNNSIQVPQVLYEVQTRKLGAPVVTSWLDKNGQVILSQTKHSGGTSFTANLINALGQVELTTEPFAGIGIDADIYFTLNSYDERGRLSERLTRVGDLNGGNGQCWRDTLYETNQGETRIDAYYIGSGCDQDALGDQADGGLTMYRSYDSAGMLRQTIDVNNKTTRYWYDAAGNPHVVRDAMNNDIVTRHDDLGRKTQVTDPNMGTKYFIYNGFGEVVMEQDVQQNSSGLANYMSYDDLGRMVMKRWNVKTDLTANAQGLAYQDTFYYGNGCGSVTAVCDQFRSSTLDNTGGFQPVQQQSFLYDAYGRLLEQQIDLINPLDGISTLPMPNPTYRVNYDYYGAYNLLKQTTYGRSGIRDTSEDAFYSVVNEYDKYGSLTKQYRNPTNTQLMRTTQFEPLRGLPKTVYLNVSQKTSYDYYKGTGQLKSIDHSNGQQTFDYSYDAWGNLTNQELNGTYNEKLSYDKLQRLTSARVGLQTEITYAYDNGGLGNLEVKSDFSSDQNYGEANHGGPNNIAGPNAITSSMGVTGVGNIHYIYDQKGNRIEDRLNAHDGQLISSYAYDANNLLIQAIKAADNETVKYRYGVDHARYLKFEDTIDDTDSIDNLEVTLWGMPGFEEVINLDTLVDQEIKLQVNDYLNVTVDELNRIKHHFMQKDRMGSITRIIDENNIEIEVKGYDAFGKPRHGLNWSPLAPAALDFDNGDAEVIDITKRGFTGHEHIDAFELIHMNGRMYDFNNGRFLSVDPYIQGVDSQALNPYSYIQNNPLAGVDPTGYAAECTNDGQCKIENVEKVEIDKNGVTTVTTSDGDVVKLSGAKITATANGKRTEITVGVAIPGGINVDTSDVGSQSATTLSVEVFGGEEQSFSTYVGNELESGAARDRIHGTATAAVAIFDPTEDLIAIKDCVVGDGGCLAAAMMILTRKIDKVGELAHTAGKAIKKGNCCFVAGTQVLTQDGMKNIEDVVLGELLWAKDVETGQSDWKPVSKIFIEPGRGIYEVQLEKPDGKIIKIEATDDHPFYVIDSGWKDTLELEVGDRIESKELGSVKVTAVIDEQREDVTYNFTVDDFHTYYVTEYGVLVHNCGDEFTSVGSPALKGDAYHPDSVAARSAENKKHYNAGTFDARGVASKLGYDRRIPPQRSPFNSHGQSVYFDGKNYITPDVDGHNVTNGWKMFDRRGRRTGTWNSDLTKRIGD